MACVQPGEKYKIISVFDHTVLDVKGESVRNNNEVIPYKWHGGDNQIFQFEARDSGGYVVWPVRQGTGPKKFVLDESQTVEGQLIVYGQHEKINQRLFLEPIYRKAFVFFIKSGYSNNVLQNNGKSLSFEPKSYINVKQRWILAEWGSKAIDFEETPEPVIIVEPLKPEPKPEPEPAPKVPEPKPDPEPAPKVPEPKPDPEPAPKVPEPEPKPEPSPVVPEPKKPDSQSTQTSAHAIVHSYTEA